ncbi:MAG TPA: arginine--tRNA ligase [Gemmatimonadaceae bacterium]|nr:arginine--tRNA ligase [Gemmatimonadaceae bacterium]
MTTAPDLIRAALVRAARELSAPEPIEPLIERPRDPGHGEWATNLALVLARPLKKKPRDIAERLVEKLALDRGIVTAVEIAGPGFINFRVAPGANARELESILRRDLEYGRSDAGRREKVNIEFVSANPTGPLHVGHGRQAAIGDAIASLLDATGWEVSREYYYNDAGAQIANLGLSVQAHLARQAGRDVAIPEGGYHGEYVREIADRYAAEHAEDRDGRDLDAITRFAVRELRQEQDVDLQAFGVRFDTYYLESSLYTTGQVEETVRALIAAGHAYEKDGALWLRTTEYGDDKDRVMRKSDGTFTYFLPDVAYHVSKWERGFHRAINVQGSDHHSTVVRVRAGLQALDMGIPAGYPEYVLHQMVTLMRGGEEVKFSKRTGTIVTVRELVDEVGRDAMRYFFLMRKGDSPLVFDIELAKKQSLENPVYYIQMAHARMSGIFRVGEIDPASVATESVSFDVLDKPEEQALIRALLDYPSLIAGAAESLEPHRVASYLHDTAGLAHAWYHKWYVLNEPDEIRSARLVLARAAQIVLRNGLQILGINAPDRM